MEGCGVYGGEGSTPVHTQVLGQLLRKEGRARRAMNVVLRLWVRGSPGASVAEPKEGPGDLRSWAETSPRSE